MSAVPVIEARELSHSYAMRGEPIQALDRMSLAVLDGELVALVGPTGCGKSTTLRILCGLLTPTGGDVRFRDEPVRGPQRAIGMVFQRPVLFPWATVRGNVEAPARLTGRRVDAALRRRVDELLDLAGLADHADAYPRELSSGMQQLLSFCMASVPDPDVLLLDEPFGALDAMTREEMGEALVRIWSQLRRTMVLVTHSIAEAVLLADRVLVCSPRPGRVAAIVDVPLPRPRPISAVTSRAFAAVASEVRLHLTRKKETS